MAKMLTKYQTFTSINKEIKADIFRDVIDIFTGLGVLIFCIFNARSFNGKLIMQYLKTL